MDFPAGWPELAAALEQAASGDGSDLATQTRAGFAELRSADFEATQAIVCADSPAGSARRRGRRCSVGSVPSAGSGPAVRLAAVGTLRFVARARRGPFFF